MNLKAVRKPKNDVMMFDIKCKTTNDPINKEDRKTSSYLI